MLATIQDSPDATATLMISADPNVPLKPKPKYRAEFDIDEASYAEFPAIFTLTELPQPAVVAADCIKEYDKYFAALPEHERDALDLNVEDRWNSREAVQRFINRSLEIAFDGDHFQAVEGAHHIPVGRLYLEVPTHSFCIGDSDGQVLDFYSAPDEFDQPFSIQARVNVTCPAAVAGF